MRPLRRTLCPLIAAFCAVMSFPTQAQVPVKIGYALAVTSHYGAGGTAWAESVEKTTNGKFKLRQFPASVLGGEREMVEGARIGTIDTIIVSTGTLSNFVPEVGVMDIPFLFRDLDHARGVLDGPIGQGILAKFTQRGLVALAWGEQGFRHLTNGKHPVNKPADLRGLKIRTMENPVHITAFRALGAAPTPMSWPEVIGALQVGVIDGQENPISVIESAKLAQVQKYLTLTGHVYSPTVLIVSAGLWSKLSADEKTAFVQGAKAGAAAMRTFIDDTERRGVESLRSAGMQIVTLSDKRAFRKALQPAYEQYYAQYSKALIERIANTK